MCHCNNDLMDIIGLDVDIRVCFSCGQSTSNFLSVSLCGSNIWKELFHAEEWSELKSSIFWVTNNSKEKKKVYQESSNNKEAIRKEVRRVVNAQSTGPQTFWQWKDMEWLEGNLCPISKFMYVLKIKRQIAMIRRSINGQPTSLRTNWKEKMEQHDQSGD